MSSHNSVGISVITLPSADRGLLSKPMTTRKHECVNIEETARKLFHRAINPTSCRPKIIVEVEP